MHVHFAIVIWIYLIFLCSLCHIHLIVPRCSSHVVSQSCSSDFMCCSLYDVCQLCFGVLLMCCYSCVTSQPCFDILHIMFFMCYWSIVLWCLSHVLLCVVGRSYSNVLWMLLVDHVFMFLCGVLHMVMVNHSLMHFVCYIVNVPFVSPFTPTLSFFLNYCCDLDIHSSTLPWIYS